MSTQRKSEDSYRLSKSSSQYSLQDDSIDDEDFDFGTGCEAHRGVANIYSLKALPVNCDRLPEKAWMDQTSVSSSLAAPYSSSFSFSDLAPTAPSAEKHPQPVDQKDSDPLSGETTLTVWILIATAAMTYTLHGFSNSVTNGILTLDTFLAEFPQTDTIHTMGPQKDHNATIQGVMVGMYQVGCAIGAMLCFFTTDRLGRKGMIHALGVINAIGVILQATAFSLPHLIIGRTIMGLGVGAGHATFPLYLAECVTSRIRGRAIIACAAAGNFGHFGGAAVELGFYFLRNSSAQWRVPVACEFIWAGLSVILPFWCVETPRYLLRKGQYERAIKSQAKLSGLDVNDEALLGHIQVLEEALHESGADELINAKSPARKWYRAGLAIFIQIMSSMSGIDVISFFSTQTFQSQLHFSALISRCLTLGLQACQWLWSTISIFLVDTLGRRPLVLGTAFMIALSMGCLSGLVSNTATDPMLKAGILFYFLVMCAYPVGYHLIPSIYAAELSPGATRHQITAVAGCLHFLCDFAVTLITPLAFASIDARYYLVYLATNVVTLVVVYFLFPETKGLELEAIDEIFETAPNCLSIAHHGRRPHFGRFGKSFSKDKKL